MSNDPTTQETMRKHRVRWYVYTGRIIDGTRERIPLPSTMTAVSATGYDVVCKCGWESRLGGGTKRAIREEILIHRIDMQ
jgi:hypothetical protein